MMAEFCDLAWPDAVGRLRTASVRSADLGEALKRLRVNPADLGWEGIDEPVRLEPDEVARRSPFDPQREVRLCRLVDERGEASPACSRSILDRALAAARASGFEVVAAAELELTLLEADSGRPVYDVIENYGIVAGAPYEGVMRTVRSLREFGVPVIGSNPEYGAGQFEINLAHGPALEAADAAVLLRTWAGAAAARAGYRASFAAKLAPELSGSGMHVHQSLWRDGANLFWADGELSSTGRSYLAGLLERMPELTPLGSPTALAYTRRSDGSFCPVNVSWSGDNRTVAVRVLAEGEGATRIEQRDAAADANPYLVFAGQIRAGLDGIARDAEPPPPTDGNAYHQPQLPPLPRTLAEALPLFAASELARETLGERAHASLCSTLAPRVEESLAGAPAGPDPDGAW